jgi:hypothetical protein
MEAGTIPSELGKLVQLTTLYSRGTYAFVRISNSYTLSNVRQLSHLECICPNVRQWSALF